MYAISRIFQSQYLGNSKVTALIIPNSVSSFNKRASVPQIKIMFLYKNIARIPRAILEYNVIVY